MKALFSILILGLCSCEPIVISEQFDPVNQAAFVDSIIEVPTGYVANRFDFPVNAPNAEGYYNAQGFGKNNHLGDDWNAVTGGNSDLGDPVYSIANGFVTFAEDIEGGWGNVIRITHYLPDETAVESLYAHCDTLLVTKNSWVKIGDQLGTIGTAHGQYIAHLHLEIRDVLGMEIGPGYSTNTKGYLDPFKFITTHRAL